MLFLFKFLAISLRMHLFSLQSQEWTSHQWMLFITGQWQIATKEESVDYKLLWNELWIDPYNWVLTVTVVSNTRHTKLNKDLAWQIVFVYIPHKKGTKLHQVNLIYPTGIDSWLKTIFFLFCLFSQLYPTACISITYRVCTEKQYGMFFVCTLINWSKVWQINSVWWPIILDLL